MRAPPRGSKIVLPDGILPASFRDPSGFVYKHSDTLYRQVNQGYKEDYEHLINSGLYRKLTEQDYLVRHEEVDVQKYALTTSAYKIIRPQVIPFVSYPYEWCFSQLKDAALLTLKIQKTALEHDMCLKDASAYNIQFHRCEPLLIDTLSFERYVEGDPWVAYRQFCQHFLCPLALMEKTDVRLNQLLKVYMDGIPIDLASKLLPAKSRFDWPVLAHIHLHAGAQKRHASSGKNASDKKLSKQRQSALIESLLSAVNKLNWEPRDTEWSNYYNETNYSDRAARCKADIVADYLDRTKPGVVWDLGANTGQYSRIVSGKGIPVVAFDVDHGAVEQNYRICRESGDVWSLPLVLDLSNPSANIGWANNERMSLIERSSADTVLALALIHHLAIVNNVPFANIAKFLARISKTLVIEFVPKRDSQIQRLLSSRKDIFDSYEGLEFERAFEKYFRIESKFPVVDTERVIYLMTKVTG